MKKENQRENRLWNKMSNSQRLKQNAEVEGNLVFEAGQWAQPMSPRPLR